MRGSSLTGGATPARLPAVPAPDPDSPRRASCTACVGAATLHARACSGGFDGGVTTLLTTLIGGVVILGVTVVAVIAYQRSLAKPGGREGLGQVGDMFGGVIDVFNPGAGRARDALEELEHAGPVTPTPDDSDDTLGLVLGADGTPRAVRLRRPG